MTHATGEMKMQWGTYDANVELDAEARGFRGRVLLDDGGGFDFFASSYDGLEREFEISAREYEAVCRDRGREPAGLQ